MVPRPDPVIWSKPSGARIPGPLSDTQLKNYEADGFIILEGLFSTDEIASHLRTVQEISNRYTSFLEHQSDMRITDTSNIVTEEAGQAIRSVFGTHKKEFFNLCRDARLVSRVSQILADDVYLFQSRLNYQSAFTGRGFEWHQDFETWYAEDGVPKPRMLSCVIYLNAAFPQNGALMVCPGSHKTYISCAGETPEENWTQSLQAQYAGVPDHKSITAIADQHGIVHCTGAAGSVLLFDSLLLHGSHSNISPWNRNNLFFVYNSVDNKAGDPIYTKRPRPEHIATRDPQWVKPIVCQ